MMEICNSRYNSQKKDQGKMIPYECLRICFTILNCKSVLQMVQMLVNCCESYECVAMHALICIMHIAGVSLCLISASLCPISLFSFKFVPIVHIHPEMLIGMQTSSDHCKCLANNKNIMACG